MRVDLGRAAGAAGVPELGAEVADREGADRSRRRLQLVRDRADAPVILGRAAGEDFGGLGARCAQEVGEKLAHGRFVDDGARR